MCHKAKSRINISLISLELWPESHYIGNVSSQAEKAFFTLHGSLGKPKGKQKLHQGRFHM